MFLDYNQVKNNKLDAAFSEFLISAITWHHYHIYETKMLYLQEIK
jgi:hypothetical protein